MCLDSSTKSKVNCTSSPVLSISSSGTFRTPRTPVERRRILSILSDLSSPKHFPDTPLSQFPLLTEEPTVSNKAGTSLCDPTISLVPPQCRGCSEGKTNASCQTIDCRIDKSVQTDTVPTPPILQPDITKILVIQEKLTDALTFISNFLTIHQSDLANQPAYNSILNEVNNTFISDHKKSTMSINQMNIDEGLRGLNPVIPVTTSNTNPEIFINLNPPLIQANCNGSLDYHITDAQKRVDINKVNSLHNKTVSSDNKLKCANIILAGSCQLGDDCVFEHVFSSTKAPAKKYFRK